MVISQIIGGLGNQMFQYAAGRALALERGEELRLDIADFADYRLHNGFELAQVFACPVQLATPENLKAILGWQAYRGIRKLLARPDFACLRRKAWVVEPHFHYWSGIHHVPQDCVLMGYWQSERYFAAHAATIRADFAFKQPLMGRNAELAEKIRAVNAVSLHVRRGDYVSNPAAAAIHGTCTPEYYGRAVARISATIAAPHFFVFSDDMAWAKANLKLPAPCEFVEHNQGPDSHYDMQLMSLCKHNIIANSTFSWWGAWLNSNPSKIVIAPRQWFKKLGFDTRDLYPAGWIVL